MEKETLIIDIFDKLSPKKFAYFEPNKAKVIEAWSDFSPKEWSPSIRDNETIVVPLKRGENLLISINAFLEHLLWLSDLKLCDGARNFSGGFKNPEQFSNTLFEIKCAYKFFVTKGISNLIFSPEVKKDKGPKRPDFKFLFENQEIYCECKSLLSVNRILESSLKRFVDLIKDSLVGLLPKHLALEILVRSIPNNLNRDFPKQLKCFISEIVSENNLGVFDWKVPGEKGRLKVALRPNDGSMQFEGDIGLGLYPRSEIFELNKKDFELIVLANKNERKTRKNTKDVVKDAGTQLPTSSLSIVFVETFDINSGVNASIDFLWRKGNQNIFCVVVYEQPMINSSDCERVIVASGKYKGLIYSLFNYSETSKSEFLFVEN